ncbi:MAG: redox-regulated ATPase YchF [Thermomicrobiales bacterium]|nr:redox-regulated ATPase YchF [Thermomicrobiales bacterium]
MTTKLVIVGLPGSGKTTVFNALTQSDVATGGFSGQDEAHVAVVKVPDERLDLLTEMFNPQRKVPADIHYVDVGGLSKGMAEKGLSGQLLGNLSQGDALVHVVRAFEDDNLPHPDGSVDAVRDIETINLELMFSDLGIVEKRIERLTAQIPKFKGTEREVNERELALMHLLKEKLEADIPLREVVGDLEPEDQKTLRGFALLTSKPLLILLNVSESQLGEESAALVERARDQFARPGVEVDALCGQIEMEIGQLSDEDAAVFLADLGIDESSRARVIRLSFGLLGLIPFFTVGPDECRAWTITRGTVAVDAAAEIHTDISRGFIRAEVVSYDDMIAAGSMAEVKKAGKFRREGKTYVVESGDIINYLFNV